MRLIDQLAARRQHYMRGIPTLPDVMLIDIPREYASTGLPLGRYYPVILESDIEWTEMAAFLAAERQTLVALALFDRRPSALRTTTIVIARYAPPQQGWPWLLLCCWPRSYAALAPADSDYFAREIYSIEVLETLDDLQRVEALLAANLAPIDPVKIDWLSSSQSP